MGSYSSVIPSRASARCPSGAIGKLRIISIRMRLLSRKSPCCRTTRIRSCQRGLCMRIPMAITPCARLPICGGPVYLTTILLSLNKGVIPIPRRSALILLGFPAISIPRGSHRRTESSRRPYPLYRTHAGSRLVTSGETIRTRMVCVCRYWAGSIVSLTCGGRPHVSIRRDRICLGVIAG